MELILYLNFFKMVSSQDEPLWSYNMGSLKSTNARKAMNVRVEKRLWTLLQFPCHTLFSLPCC